MEKVRARRRAATLLLLLCTSVWCAIASTAAPRDQVDASKLLLVVGSVTSSQARVLFDRSAGVSTLHVRVFTTSGADRPQPAVFELKREFSVNRRATGTPNVLLLDDLEPDRVYVVGLRVASSDEEEVVKFRTPQLPTSDARCAPDRVLVVSCDRYVDDQDDTLWQQIVDDIESHPDSYFGMAHLGDQVYMDAGAASIPVEPVQRELMLGDPELLRQRFDALLDQFRAIYRRTFGQPVAQRALRNGAHWMIPDDHEVINNLDYERMQRVFGSAEETSSRASEREQEQLWGLALHYRAGLQVYYEYQYQLRADLPFAEVDFLFEPLGEIVARFPVHFAVEVHKLKLFFMDLRVDRSFFKKSDEREMLPQLIGKAQMKQLETQLEHWSVEDQENAVVVLSSVPLFFHSAFTGAITYVVEKDKYPGMQAQLPGLDALFKLFTRYSRKGDSTSPVLKLLVGGDVHFLAHSHVCVRSAASRRCLDQLITSGITKGSTAIADLKLVPFYFLIARVTPFVSKLVTLLGLSQLAGLPPWDIQYDKLYLGRNFG